MPGENDSVNDGNEAKVFFRPIILCFNLKWILVLIWLLNFISTRSVETIYATFAGEGRSAVAIYIQMMLIQMLLELLMEPVEPHSSFVTTIKMGRGANGKIVNSYIAPLMKNNILKHEGNYLIMLLIWLLGMWV